MNQKKPSVGGPFRGPMSSSRVEGKTENNQTKTKAKKLKHTNKTKTNKTHKEPEAAR